MREISNGEGSVTLPRSEYDRIMKNNFIAKKIMQFLYDNCKKASYSDDELTFSTMYLNELLKTVDTEYYAYMLDIKRKEAERNESK